jgi:methionine sulfoxide reductase heme-binding subunit
MIIAQITTTSSPFYWYLTRDMAIAAYLTLTLSVLFGLAISLSRVTGERVMWHIQDLHYTFATLTGVLMIGHMLTLMLDSYLPFSVTNLLIPFSQPSGVNALTVDLGVISFYGMLSLLLSSWFKKRLAYTVWRAIHYVSFGTFILVTIHGWLTGSDSVTTLMVSLYFGCTLAVGALIAARIFISPQTQKGKPPRAIPVSLIAAIIIGVIGTIAMFIVRNTVIIG